MVDMGLKGALGSGSGKRYCDRIPVECDARDKFKNEGSVVLGRLPDVIAVAIQC